MCLCHVSVCRIILLVVSFPDAVVLINFSCDTYQCPFIVAYDKLVLAGVD